MSIFRPAGSSIDEQVESAAAAHLLRETERMEEDLQQARAVQRFLLPAEMQLHEAYRAAYVYQPLDYVGGDFVDTVQRADGWFVMMIGDVSGHGIAAALTSAMLKSAFLRWAEKASGPGELLRMMDGDLRETMRCGRFVTAIAAWFHAETKELVVASAGHPHPLLLRDGGVETLEIEPQVPLFTGEETAYADVRYGALRRDDRVLLFTDGILEAAHASGEMLTDEEICGLVNICAVDSNFAQCLYESLLFSDIVFKDDVTLMALEIR